MADSMLLSLYRTCRGFAERVDDGFWRRWRMSAEARAHNVILTGFPRSGTSLFSTLLNGLDNAICLNEVSPTPCHFHFFGRVRRRIEDGRPVRNQYGSSGELTTNTRGLGVRTEARMVKVRDRHFVLAQKYTLPYLNRLEQLCAEEWRVWVLVRYEDLVANPAAVMGRFCEAHDLELPADFAPELSSRNQPLAYGLEGEVLRCLAAESCDLELFGYR